MAGLPDRADWSSCSRFFLMDVESTFIAWVTCHRFQLSFCLPRCKKNKRNLMNPQRSENDDFKKKNFGESRFVHIFPSPIICNSPTTLSATWPPLATSTVKTMLEESQGIHLRSTQRLRIIQNTDQTYPKKTSLKMITRSLSEFSMASGFFRTQRTSYRVWCCTIAWLLTCEGWSQMSEVIVSWALLGATGPH